ncbi:Xylanase [Cystobacter fuscus DSM 2262]|uniref:Xylanase n=1 Tax=Cystobacter fuscus (strain ATCC 25194 / DSM 2262 / NBRC 100088 / M29) TaxID=1242864 RepID=S9R6D9_CYSF2|nr:glycoside hydrolase family 30 beta sandwich domain-containing protein [Cystobacter fuscus]EPX64558.1 Xylanase [Cystobacter fuscus DSM 2262]
MKTSFVSRALLPLLGACLFGANASAQDIVIDPSKTHQVIRGFGGMNGPGWIDDLTPAQIDLAFGSDVGQLGLSIMRMRIDPSNSRWNLQVPSAARARAKGVLLLGSPWTPPAYMKSNNNLNNGGKLLPQYYEAYATHLLGFASYMANNNASLYAISLQNEPDWHPDYESADWSGTDFVNFLNAQGARFGTLKVLASESLNFNPAVTDPILNSATASQHVDIVGGHLYGVQPKDYPLARSKGKELWMTEHYTDNTDGNVWPSALEVGSELHKSMVANYSGYIWWYIRRSYGLISENGSVSKRGYVMSQFARFVRPGSVRIGTTEKPYSDVYATAYATPDGKIVLVVVNTSTQHRVLNVSVPSGRVARFTKYGTSSSLNVGYGGGYQAQNGKASFYVDPQSIATFVGEATASATGASEGTSSGD